MHPPEIACEFWYVLLFENKEELAPTYINPPYILSMISFVIDEWKY